MARWDPHDDRSFNWSDDSPVKVNLGCGVDIRPGYVNVDRMPLEGVDVVADLDDRDKVMLPFEDDSVDEWLAIDLVEHIVYPLPMFQELWRCSKPGAKFETAMPYGTSDDAWEDPTHVRPWFRGSWMYLSQCVYYRADYGYTADWSTKQIVLDVPDSPATPAELAEMLMMYRNLVLRQYVTLHAVKPARARDPELLEAPPVFFRKMQGG